MENAFKKISFSLEADSDIDRLVDEAGGAGAVLIGEATHGTSEFYTWRAKITKRLIAEKGFKFVAVEGDWPDCYQVNSFVKDPIGSNKTAHQVLRGFNRWPTWMWANFEVQDFVEWLANHNKDLPPESRVGFYGLDIYSLWQSLSVAVKYLEETMPQAAQVARRAYRCFEPYRHNIEGYAWHNAFVPESCEDEIVKLLSTLEHLPPIPSPNAAEEKLSAEQNALVALDAERYYRIMLEGDPEAWNMRGEHMANTFFRLMDFYEERVEPKGIIWAHNTHVGDARATEMADIGEFNIGQIVRDAFGMDRTYIIGFATYEGSVVAADDWDAPMKIMPLPPAVYDSWEHDFHSYEAKDRIAIFSLDREAAKAFSERKGQRAVGVVYDPNAEFANYVPTVLNDRYDALLYIEKTTPVHPIHMKPEIKGPPETYPSAA